MNTYIKQWFPLLLLLLVGTGCADEQLISGSNLVAGKTVKVDLNLNIPQAEVPIAPVTRSAGSGATFSVALQPSENIETRSDGTTPLHNLWLFQFDASGKALVRKEISTTDAPVNDMVTLSVDLVVGSNQTLYIVVLGKELTSDLSKVSTLAELESYPFEYISTAEGVSFSRITKDEDVPFAGKTVGVEVFAFGNDGRGFVKYNSPVGFTGGVMIKRLMAKIEITCDYNTAGFALTGAQLDNVASTFGVNPDNASSTAFRYESLKPDMVADGTSAAHKHTFTWYVAPNMKGTADAVATEQDRHNKHTAVPANATRIYFWARNITKPSDYSVYEVYVGKNATSNFDVAANNLYQMDTEMKVVPGSIQDDGRVVYPNVFKPNVELYSSEKGEVYDLDAHYDFRPLTIDGFGQRFVVTILDKDGNPASESDSWLKISSASDYTNAKRNDDLKLTTSAQAILPVPLHFYIYADEYVVPNEKPRSMKVRVTASALDGTNPTNKDFTLQQRSIVNVGYWGGKMGDDGYSSLLGMEQIEEYKQEYKSYSVTTKVRGLPWGYFGVDVMLHNWFASGKEHTRVLAENPKNWKIIDFSEDYSAGKYDIQPIKNLDGSPLLSQYTYYNSYAARYCYDKNRDENGNGKIDPDELKWYLPTTIQLDGIWIQAEEALEGTHYSSIADGTKFCFAIDMGWGNRTYTDKYNLYPVRCVREI